MPIRYDRDFSNAISVVSANVVSVEAALSTRIDGVTGGTGSVTSTELSAAANASTATSSPALSNAISNDHSVSAVIIADVASHIASTSAIIKTDIASVSAAIMADVASHLASTSATIKTDIASVSAAIMADAASHLTSASAVIKTDINSVSAAIMADVASHLNSASGAIMIDVASHLTSTSAVIKTDIASVSAAIKVDINSVSAAISTLIVNQIASASAAIKTDVVSAINTLSNLASNWVSAAANASTATSSPAISNAISNDHSVSAVIKADIASVSAAIKADIASVSAAIIADVASHLASTSIVLKADLASVSAVLAGRAASISAEVVSLAASADAALSARVTSVLGLTGTGAAPFGLAQHFVFDTTTADADPGSGKLRLNNATQGAATFIYADNNNAIGSDCTAMLDAYFGTFSVGQMLITLTKKTDPSAFIAFVCTSAITDGTGYRKIAVSQEARSSDNPFANADAVILTAAFLYTTSNIASINTQLASASAQLRTDITSVKAYVDGVSARSVGNVETKGLQSVIDALSNRISAGGGTASVTSTELSAAKYMLATAQTVSYTLVLGDAQTTVQMNNAGAVNLTVPLNATVAFPLGTQIVIEQLGAGAVTIVATGGVTLQGAPLVSNGQYSTIVLVKQATDTWLVGNMAGALASVSAAVMADVASHLTSTSALIKTDIASVSAAIKADINSVSAAISTLIVNQLASASAAIKTDLMSAINVLSNIASNATSAAANASTATSSPALSIMSVAEGAGQYHMMGTAQNISTAATWTKLSGLSVSLVGSGFYRIHGAVVFGPQGAGSTTAVFQLGMSATAQPKFCSFRLMGPDQNVGAANPVGSSAFIQYAGVSAISATPSIMFSVRPVTSGFNYACYFDGVVQASTVQSQLKVVAQTTTTANGGTTIIAGSFIQAYKIG